MQIWPGQPYPLGATFDGVGTNFSLFSEAAERVELCLFDEAGKETRVDLPEITALCWHVYLPQSPAGPALRLPRARPVGTRPGPLVQPEQAAARSLRQGHRRHVELERGGLSLSLRRARELEERSRQRAVLSRDAVVINPFFDWGSDRRPNTPWHKTVVYETHVKGFTKRHPDIPEELRGTYAGDGAPGRDQVPAAARRHRRRAAAGAPVRAGLDARRRRGLRNYWGYNSIGYLAPHNEYAPRQLRRAGAGVQAPGEDAARRRHRSDPRRRLQPHGRGQSSRADAVVQGHRQRRLLPADGGQAPLLHGLHRHRQHPEHAASARAAADHGQPALLGARHARRRLPLRSRGDAGARAARRRSAVGVLRPHPAGSGRQPGQADRRAVGRRRRRLPGRQLSAAVVGVERQVPRHRARLLARHRSDARRVRLPVHRQLRSVRGHRAPAVREHQLHHRARRLHAARPRVVQREAQRGQRRGQPRRREPQPLVELRRRRADRRSRRCSRSATARCATS